MFTILSYIIFGLIVGLASKYLHPGEDPVGFIPTVGIGIAGSFLGGVLQWVMDLGNSPFAAAGWVFSIIGGVMFCYLYRRYRFERFLKIQGRYPENIIKKKEDQ